MKIIEQALNKSKNPAIGFSGGKDSTVILDLIRKINPDVPAVFCNTGVEHQLTIKYIKKIPNLIMLHPEHTFWEAIDQMGHYPMMKGKDSTRTNLCCEWLKDRPMKNFIKEYNIDLVFDGLTSAESWQRHMFLTHYGKLHKVKSWGNIWKCHPISDWKPIDVWRYIHEHQLSYNKIYDPPISSHRCGCITCTAHIGWEERLSRESPKLLSKILREKGQLQLM